MVSNMSWHENFTVTLSSLFHCTDVILKNKVYYWTSAPTIGQALLKMGDSKEGNLIWDCKCLCAYIMYESKNEPSWQKTHTAVDQQKACKWKYDGSSAILKGHHSSVCFHECCTGFLSFYCVILLFVTWRTNLLPRKNIPPPNSRYESTLYIVALFKY